MLLALPVAISAPAPQYTRRLRPAPVFAARGFAGLGVVQVLDPSTVATIAGTIQQVEGYYPGSLAYRNNNPGNLVYAGQAGATMGDGGFAKFASYSDGLQALNNQIQLYAARGLTIADMMAIYAPASDGNDPAGYAAQIAGALGVSPQTSLLQLAGIGMPAAVPAIDLGGGFAVDGTTLFLGGGLVLLALALSLD